MLEKKNRLKRDAEFKKVFSKGRSIFDSVCGIKFASNSLPYSRFAVVIGTKVSKSAVKRNAARRQYSEIIRLNLATISNGYDVILLASKKSLPLNYDEKQKNILQVLKKAKLIS